MAFIIGLVAAVANERFVVKVDGNSREYSINTRCF